VNEPVAEYIEPLGIVNAIIIPSTNAEAYKLNCAVYEEVLRACFT
jgi:hypothetical protein